ncbi:MAG: phosphate ABC transporter permease subunit PstC [Candidatus Eisenbacteria bacterium]|nr:phosphate ABC transporter permease subunit PstC [Candidatus Eisenbacteria bacterium]
MRPAAQRAAGRRADVSFRLLTAFCAVLVIVVMGAIFLELVDNSLLSIRTFGFGFLTSDAWNPGASEFGALSSIYGTLVSTGIAMLIAVPLGLVIAIFLVEVAHPTVSRLVGGAVELLAAIPSIIYGMWGLFVFAGVMQNHVQPALGDTLGFLPLFQGPPMGIGMLTAGIVLAIMVLPFVTAVTRDVLLMVPPVLKESAHGVGSTMWESVRNVSLRYGRRGIIGAVFLGFGRALGETMAVTFVIGNSHRISASLFAAGNTIASSLANEFNEASEPLYLSSLVQLALVLFAITLVFQSVAHVWVGRLQQMETGQR